MKVTTDGCLFGAIAAVEFSTTGMQRVLDIGTGTGLLSLMYAQQNSSAILDAVELVNDAAMQAEFNVANSKYSSQIHIHHCDIKNYYPAYLYDSIICNPPFYTKELKGSNENKNIAHHDTGLLLPELLGEIQRLINPTGKFCLLLPNSRASFMIGIAGKQGWFCYNNISVHQTEMHGCFRNILFFSQNKTSCKESHLVIKSGNEYTSDFKQFLNPYYLYL